MQYNNFLDAYYEYLANYYNAVYQAELDYIEYLKDKLDTIRSAPFTVINPNDAGMATLDWDSTPVTVAGDFEFYYPDLWGDFSSIPYPYELLEVQVMAHGNGQTYYGSYSTAKVQVTGAVPGTTTYYLEICYTYIDYSYWGYVSDCYAQNSKPVTVAPPSSSEPTVYVLDEKIIYDGDADNCPSGYLGLKSIVSPPSELCVAGEEVDDDTNGTDWFDVIICDIFGICESAAAEFPEVQTPDIRDIVNVRKHVDEKTEEELVVEVCASPTVKQDDYPTRPEDQALMNTLSSAPEDELADEIYQQLKDEMHRWGLIRLVGTTGERLVAECYRRDGFEVHEDLISLRVYDYTNLNVDGTRYPDLAVREHPWEEWIFIEVKVNTARPSRTQLRRDKTIEQSGHFEGINGPIGIAETSHRYNAHEVLLWRVLFAYQF